MDCVALGLNVMLSGTPGRPPILPVDALLNLPVKSAGGFMTSNRSLLALGVSDRELARVISSSRSG